MKRGLKMSILLSKFENIKIENDTRISEFDRAFCEKQEKMYYEAKNAMQQTLELFKSIYENYSDDIKKNYKGYIDRHKDIIHAENRMEKFKSEFISNIIYHFQNQYNVTLESGEIRHKFKQKDIAYQDIVNEIFEQLGGFNFKEKAIKEIKDKCRDTIYNADKITIKKNKMSIQDFVWWHDDWRGKKGLSYGDSKVSPLFKALSHFEAGETEMLGYYINLYQELNRGEEEYDIFSKYELGYNKVESIKLYKNGKIDIVFQSTQDAIKFKNEYLIK